MEKNQLYNKQTRVCDIKCEEGLIYYIEKDVCNCELGQYYNEDDKKCVAMCKEGETYDKESNNFKSKKW